MGNEWRITRSRRLTGYASGGGDGMTGRGHASGGSDGMTGREKKSVIEIHHVFEGFSELYLIQHFQF